MITLTISDKAGQQSRLDFHKTEISIGRMKENDIVLPKGNVSKKHATITLQDGQFIVVDYESTNGSYLNGRKLNPHQAYTVLPEVDKLYIGDFIIQMEPPVGHATGPAPMGGLPPLPPSTGPLDDHRAGFETLFDAGDRGHGQDLRSTFTAPPQDMQADSGPNPPYDPLRRTQAGNMPHFDMEPMSAGATPATGLNIGATPYVPQPTPAPFAPPQAPPQAPPHTSPHTAPPQTPPQPPLSTRPPTSPVSLPPIAPVARPPQPPAASPVAASVAPPAIAPIQPVSAPHPSKPSMPTLTPSAYVYQRPEIISEFDADFFVAQLDAMMALMDLAPMSEWPRTYPVEESERARFSGLVEQAIQEANPQVDRAAMSRVLLAEAVGLGALDLYLDDRAVQDIYVNQYSQVMLRKEGKLCQAPYVYSTPEALRLVAERLLGQDASILGADELRFGDGTRVHVVMPPAAVGGPLITVRKPPTQHPSLTDLIQREVLSPGMADFLMRAVDAGRSIAICGPTSSGKTTLLSALASLVHDGMRLVAVEDYSHIELPQASAVRLEANVSAGFDKRFLLRQALSMHPQRILLDECKGSEGYDWVTSVAAGTEGSMITLHGINANDALGRLESLCYLGSDRVSPRGLREQIARAVNLVVVVNRVGNQQFRVQQITEVQGVDLDAYRLNDIFYYRASGAEGTFHPTGFIPLFYEDMQQAGLDVDFDIFRE